MKVKVIRVNENDKSHCSHQLLNQVIDVTVLSEHMYSYASGDKGCLIEKEYCCNWEEEVRTFESGAKRDGNSEKPFVHNLKGYTRLRFGYHMTKGALKYGDKNWELGMTTESYIESIDRHWAKYLNGDRSEDNLSAIIFGINGIMENEKKEGIKEDYYFKLDKK